MWGATWGDHQRISSQVIHKWWRQLKHLRSWAACWLLLMIFLSNSLWWNCPSVSPFCVSSLCCVCTRDVKTYTYLWPCMAFWYFYWDLLCKSFLVSLYLLFQWTHEIGIYYAGILEGLMAWINGTQFVIKLMKVLVQSCAFKKQNVIISISLSSENSCLTDLINLILSHQLGPQVVFLWHGLVITLWDLFLRKGSMGWQ